MGSKIHYCLIIALLMIIAYSHSIFAIMVEIKVKDKKNAEVTLLLEDKATSEQKHALTQIKNTINESYSGRMEASVVFNDPDFINEGIRVNIQDIRFFQDTLNFLDFNYRESFFKEKYYFKLLLNPQMFHSKFFSTLLKNLMTSEMLNCLFHPGGELHIECKLPGNCSSTSMEMKNDKFFYRISYQDFNAFGSLIEIESFRFLPHIYMTVFFLLLILVFLLLRFGKTTN